MTSRKLIGITTTGAAAEHLPADGPERDEILGLVRLGLRFRAQQDGRRPGFMRRYLIDLARKLEPPMTFERLLLQLAFEAQRRAFLGAAESPIEKIDRAADLVTYHDPKHGRLQVTFKTLRNHWTAVKKNLGK